MALWTSIVAPWLQWADLARWRADLRRLQALQPDAVLSSHLPPARSRDARRLPALAAAGTAAQFVGPDQAALEAALAVAA
jgi:hypothetical protein